MVSNSNCLIKTPSYEQPNLNWLLAVLDDCWLSKVMNKPKRQTKSNSLTLAWFSAMLVCRFCSLWRFIRFLWKDGNCKLCLRRLRRETGLEDFFWNCEISVDVVIEFWFVFGDALSALSDGTAAPSDDVGSGDGSLSFDDVEPAVRPTLFSCSAELWADSEFLVFIRSNGVWINEMRKIDKPGRHERSEIDRTVPASAAISKRIENSGFINNTLIRLDG